MSALIVILLTGAGIAAAIIVGGRIKGSARLAVIAATAAGLGGYMLAGVPGLPGASARTVTDPNFGRKLEDPRRGMTRRFGAVSQILQFSDAILRSGRTALAADYLAQALQRYPRDADLWVGYGNALIVHAGGLMTPAAEIAFARASAIAPDHPAPAYFAGVALAQAGDVAGARRAWRGLLARSDADAPWRADVEGRLAALDRAAPPRETAPAAGPIVPQ